MSEKSTAGSTTAAAGLGWPTLGADDGASRAPQPPGSSEPVAERAPAGGSSGPGLGWPQHADDLEAGTRNPSEQEGSP